MNHSFTLIVKNQKKNKRISFVFFLILIIISFFTFSRSLFASTMCWPVKATGTYCVHGGTSDNACSGTISGSESDAAAIQTIIVQLLQTNQNINWWQKTLSILKKENSLHNLSNLNFDQLKNVYVTSVKLTDSEFQSSNNLGIENQELIFVSDVQLIQNEDQTFDCQLIWIFNISCPLGNSCRINYNQLPSLVSLQ